MSGCTHDCNQGRNCTCQIAVAQPSRQTLQAEGKHPAPCARFCEAKAFEIEIRQLKAQIESLKVDADRFVRLAEYLISDSTDHDDEILSAETINEMREVIDEMKGAT